MADIIRIDRDADTPFVAKKAQSYDSCRHIYVDIDTELRRVECRDCGEVLDPVEVLIGLAERYTERDRRWNAIQDFEAKERARDAKRRERNRKQPNYAELPTPAPGVG